MELSAVFSTRSRIICAVWFLLYIHCTKAMYPGSSEKSWTYEFKSIETNTSDKELMYADWTVERIGRGVYAMTGTYTINYDIVDGDNNEIEGTSYISPNGVDNYKPLPFKVPRMHLFKFFNTFYKDVAMETFKKCSNMPVFVDEFVPPYEKKTYKLDKCQFNTDGLPAHLQDGFYKILLSSYGTVDWVLNIIVEVQRK